MSSHVPLTPQLWETETGESLVYPGGQPSPDSVGKPCLVESDTAGHLLLLEPVHTPHTQIEWRGDNIL